MTTHLLRDRAQAVEDGALLNLRTLAAYEPALAAALKASRVDVPTFITLGALTFLHGPFLRLTPEGVSLSPLSFLASRLDVAVVLMDYLAGSTITIYLGAWDTLQLVCSADGAGSPVLTVLLASEMPTDVGCPLSLRGQMS